LALTPVALRAPYVSAKWQKVFTMCPVQNVHHLAVLTRPRPASGGPTRGCQYRQMVNILYRAHREHFLPFGADVESP